MPIYTCKNHAKIESRILEDDDGKLSCGTQCGVTTAGCSDGHGDGEYRITFLSWSVMELGSSLTGLY